MNGAGALVYVIDDEVRTRRALERLLDSASYRARSFPGIGELLSDHDADPGGDPSVPGCILLDLTMREGEGLKAQATLAASGCALPVIVLARDASIDSCVAALRAGAVDFLLKPVDERRLLEAVGMALAADLQNRRVVLCRRIVAQRVRMLTPREREVLRHVVSGRLNKQIAAEIGTVEKTVKVHRSRVMHKMGVRSVVELMQLAHCAEIFSGDGGNFVHRWMQRNGVMPPARRA